LAELLLDVDEELLAFASFFTVGEGFLLWEAFVV
jgi:hypothetical protein